MFGLSIAWSYILGIGPPALYLLICFLVKADTQIYIASIATGFYAIVMTAVLIGTVVEIATDGLFGPSGIFFVCKSSSSAVKFTSYISTAFEKFQIHEEAAIVGHLGLSKLGQMRRLFCLSFWLLFCKNA